MTKINNQSLFDIAFLRAVVCELQMFVESDTAAATQRSIAVLRITLAFVFLTSMLLLFFVTSLYGESFGYCDRREVQGADSFALLLVLEILLQLPIAYFYHEVSAYQFSAEGGAGQSTLGMSFVAYIGSAGILFYQMLDLFLNGSSDNSRSTILIVFSVVLFFASMTLLIRFERALE